MSVHVHPARKQTRCRLNGMWDGRMLRYRLWSFDITHGGGGPGVRKPDEFRIQITNGPSTVTAFDKDGAVDLLFGYSRDREAIVAYDHRWLERWTQKKENNRLPRLAFGSGEERGDPSRTRPRHPSSDQVGGLRPSRHRHDAANLVARLPFQLSSGSARCYVGRGSPGGGSTAERDNGRRVLPRPGVPV